MSPMWQNCLRRGAVRAEHCLRKGYAEGEGLGTDGVRTQRTDVSVASVSVENGQNKGSQDSAHTGCVWRGIGERSVGDKGVETSPLACKNWAEKTIPSCSKSRTPNRLF
jgi:hypothetical protein